MGLSQIRSPVVETSRTTSSTCTTGQPGEGEPAEWLAAGHDEVGDGDN